MAGKHYVLKVGRGRGFAIVLKKRRLVLTAAHCLPKNLPPATSYLDECAKTRKLLGRIDRRRSVWAEYLFVDPIADIAVLGRPDGDKMHNRAKPYDELMQCITPLRVGECPAGASKGSFLYDRSRFDCAFETIGDGGLCITRGDKQIKEGMSGSPILGEDGRAIGVVVAGSGPHPRLTSHLPGWLLEELGALRRNRSRRRP